MSQIGNIHSNKENMSIDRFQCLVDAIKDYAIYMLDPDGHIISWNSGAERFKGYSELEVLGRHFSCFYTPEDIAADLPKLALATARLEGHFEAEGWRVRKDGTRIFANIVIDPIYQNGKLIGFAKVTRDITQKIRAEQELISAREALQQAQRMEVLSRVTGGIAHDFNNMMTVMRSSTERLMEDNLPEDQRKRCMQLMTETIDHATSLTNQLITMVRRQPLRPEQFDVVDRILGIRGLLGTTLTDRIQLKLHLAPDLTQVDTDRHQFETTIINLVVNARDALLRSAKDDDRLTVTISASPVSGIPAVRGNPPVAGAYVAISIADNGPGIDEETLDHIFEPFFTTKEGGQGAGLGLSQVHDFVKQSGGEVDVTSEAGKGAMFTLYLPRVRRRVVAARSIPESPAAQEEPALSGKLLLVEDNGRIAEVTVPLLEDLGLTPVWAPDAEDALLKLQEEGAGYDIVMTDVVMPGMSGIALARVISQRWPNLPVVLTSGYSDDLTAGQGGDFDLIPKPYSRKALIATLGRHLKPEPEAA
jgi:PAS domain S-box-containing protein